MLDGVTHGTEAAPVTCVAGGRVGVLLGGRSEPQARNLGTYLTTVWFPTAVMLLVIARESTERFSSLHTGVFLRPVFTAVLGTMTDERWKVVHHLIRKTGHFVGYGILGLTWLRAWLYTWLMPLRFQAIEQWRGLAWRMAICCTSVVAGLDEMHQTWIPDRTGVAQDVLLDTLGATVLCGGVALWWRVRLKA